MQQNRISRKQVIENTVRIAMAILSGRITVPPDVPIFELAQGVDELTAEEQFERLNLIVSTKVTDVTADEVMAALSDIQAGYEFDNWIISQLEEIRKRHVWPEDVTIGDFLPRAAAAGDQQAQKLIDMGILDLRTSPTVEAADAADPQ